MSSSEIVKIILVDELPESRDSDTIYITKEDPCRIYLRDTEVTDLFNSSLTFVEGYSDIENQDLSYNSSVGLLNLFNSSIKGFSKEVTDSQSIVVLDGLNEKVQGLTDQGLLPEDLLNQVVSEIERPDIRPSWEVW